MTTAVPRSPSRTLDVVGTVLLIIVGTSFGIFVGGLYLIFATASPNAGGWIVASVVMMVAPVITAVLGIVLLTRRRLAFWVPLLGIVIVVAMLAVLSAVAGAV
jgi:hypothetical protein